MTRTRVLPDTLPTDGVLTLPAPDEDRFEWGVWWHSGDPRGIVIDEAQFGSRQRALRRARQRLGEYGTTSFTIVRRRHLRWSDMDGELDVLSTLWAPDPDPAD